MGLMYWQINDIWQAPTWASIEYGLKWKMAHYYVQHMYEPIYPLAILKPYLAKATDESARISLYVISERFNGVNGSLICSFLSLDTFTPRSTFAFDVPFNSPAVKHITDLPYATLMRSARCSNSSECIMHCSFNSSQEQIGQTLLFTRPKNYQLYQPNLQIQSIQQVTPTNFSITITATRPALFVWLDVTADISGYFSRNGFHMFEPIRTINFYSWTPVTNFDRANFDLRISSLFDVTEP
jgi:beta-mannosidase